MVAADYDNDGYVDFYVSNLYGGNFLYHNNHNNTFTEVSEKAGVHQPQSQSFATWFFDYDNDGWPDIFVTQLFLLCTTRRCAVIWACLTNAETLQALPQHGDGTFQDVTATSGSKGDHADGCEFRRRRQRRLSRYLSRHRRSGIWRAECRNMLLRNHEGKYFADVTARSGTGELHKGHGVAFADLKQRARGSAGFDGGATPGDAHAFRVFENPGNDNDWITVKLVGVKSNRAGIGARIKLTVEKRRAAPRSIYRTVGSGGSFGANPIEQHIGLGKDAKIEALEVWWPASNSRQRLQSVQKNQFIEVTEFAKQYRILPRKAFQLSRDATAAAPAGGKSAP